MFKVDDKSARSVTFSATDKSIDCIQICRDESCDDYEAGKSKIVVKNLSPDSEYKFMLWSCGDHKNFLKKFLVRTLHDSEYIPLLP